jgi:hypothetical protein
VDISINGVKIEYRIETETTVGEILGSLESECEKSGMTITGISVDGAVMQAEKLDKLFAKKIAEIGKIELTTLSGAEILESLRNLGTRFNACVPLLREIPIELQTGKDLAVLETINGFSVALQSLYQILPLVSLTGMAGDDAVIDGIPLKSFPAQLAPVLGELLAALENKDTVLVGDLSEYELAPKIEILGAYLSAVK